MQHNPKMQMPVSVYAGQRIFLTTKHQKAQAIAPVFASILGAQVIENEMDTDQLGTFSGEVERQGSALDAVREKCEWGLRTQQSDFALASEGSFGPHPAIPFIATNVEVLYFKDVQRDFYVYLSEVFTDTNYQMQALDSLQQLQQFAQKAKFPEHALLLRPHPYNVGQPIFKGIRSMNDLEAAFLQAQKMSVQQQVWVETDMRAHMNPTRMHNIGVLAKKLALRLSCLCPKCQTPGWGQTAVERGLSCECCGTPTELVKAEVFACAKCDYQLVQLPAHGLSHAEQRYCPYCNP